MLAKRGCTLALLLDLSPELGVALGTLLKGKPVPYPMPLCAGTVRLCTRTGVFPASVAASYSRGIQTVALMTSHSIRFKFGEAPDKLGLHSA